MELNEVLDFLNKKASYIGRSLAYYEDGRDFGVVTMIGVKKSRFPSDKLRIIVFSEKDKIILSTDAKSPAKVLVDESKVTLPLAPYGKTYFYSFETEDGKTIYISPFE